MLATLMALAVLLGAGDDSPAIAPPPTDDFLVVPVRVHILTADDLPEIDCKLVDADIRRVFGKVNAVWRPAGIFWGVESIVREPAARRERFRVLRDLADGGPLPLGAYRRLAPDATRSSEGMNVYYLHKFPVNGVYLGDRVAFIQETAALREVPGGIDEPLPRVTAHELGHALGLPHRQARTNLLASGTTGTEMNAAEIASARRGAEAVPGVIRMPELRRRAAKSEKDADPNAGAWLDQIAGTR